MLTELLDELARAVRDDDPFVRVDGVEFSGDDAEITLSVMPSTSEAVGQRWRVHAEVLREISLAGRSGELELHTPDHVLARLHSADVQELTFSGVPRSVPELIGQLRIAHRALVGERASLSRFLNAQVELDALLHAGHGQLARGPAFLMQAYASVLTRANLQASLLPARRPKRFKDGAWIECNAACWVLEIGSSYFVAERFEATRLPDAPA